MFRRRRRRYRHSIIYKRRGDRDLLIFKRVGFTTVLPRAYAAYNTYIRYAVRLSYFLRAYTSRRITVTGSRFAPICLQLVPTSTSVLDYPHYLRYRPIPRSLGWLMSITRTRGRDRHRHCRRCATHPSGVVTTPGYVGGKRRTATVSESLGGRHDRWRSRAEPFLGRHACPASSLRGFHHIDNCCWYPSPAVPAIASWTFSRRFLLYSQGFHAFQLRVFGSR